MAVDVEPTVFWDGEAPSPHQLLERWKHAVGFEPSHHGTVRPGHNGPSGLGLADRILRPLGIAPSTVAFTDAVPWFFVKHGSGSQGAAIAERFASWAIANNVDQGSLPSRPTSSALPRLACSEPRRSTLLAEIAEIGAPLIITLGQEALDAVRGVADPDTMSGVQRSLEPAGYGALGHATFSGHRCDLLPVVHPGFQRQTKRPDWRAAFERWETEASL